MEQTLERTKKANANNAFHKGLDFAMLKDQSNIKQEIRAALGIKGFTQQSFSLRACGYSSFSPAERTAIEGIFKKYGVPAHKVWGFKTK